MTEGGTGARGANGSCWNAGKTEVSSSSGVAGWSYRWKGLAALAGGQT